MGSVQRHTRGRTRDESGSWVGQPAAIYCRISRARDNDRGEVTVGGKPWQPYAVRSVLSSWHVTGIRVFSGQEAGEGDWAPIIDRGTWREVQERRSYRASAYDRRGWRFYLLRGLVVCKNCGWRMAGCTSKGASYMCAKHTYLGPERCHRRIGAARLEDFVTDAAVELLTHLDVSGAPSAATALSAGDEAVISADEAELKDMWTHRELSTREYRAMRKTVEDRITTLRRKTIVRPTVEVLAGLVGADARAAWDRLAAGGQQPTDLMTAWVLADRSTGSKAGNAACDSWQRRMMQMTRPGRRKLAPRACRRPGRSPPQRLCRRAPVRPSSASSVLSLFR